MYEAGLAGLTDILNRDFTDVNPTGNADIHYKARIFSFYDMLLVEIFISTLSSNVIKSQV